MNATQDLDSIRRVLVVAYVFPPAGGAGVQRVTKFVKYLPECGWDCSVLTVANPSVPVFDESLAAEIPESTVVRLAKTMEPGYALKNALSAGNDGAPLSGKSGGIRKWLKSAVRAAGNAILQPDAQILWYPDAIKQGLQLLAELQHDAIFVTAPPFSSFVTAAELSRRSGLPLIVDYRDEWGISNRFQENRQKSNLSNWLQDRMQRKVLRRASAVVATTRRSAESVAETVQRAGSNASVSCIYNGYDAADIALPAATGDAAAEDAVDSDSQHLRSGRKLRIAYVGTLWNLTSIEPVVEAIQKLNDDSPDKARRIELVVAGRRTKDQEAILDRLATLPCDVIREGYVEHRRAIEIMRQSDIQCLLLSDVPEAGRVVPAKTFEYLALGRKMLSVGPAGEVSEILSGVTQAESFLPSNIDGIADYLSRQLDGAELELTVPDSTYATRFERRWLTRQLAEVLNQTCGIETKLRSSGNEPAVFANTPAEEGTCDEAVSSEPEGAIA